MVVSLSLKKQCSSHPATRVGWASNFTSAPVFLLESVCPFLCSWFVPLIMPSPQKQLSSGFMFVLQVI